MYQELETRLQLIFPHSPFLVKPQAPADRRRARLHCVSNIGLLQPDPGVHAAGARGRSQLPHPNRLPRGQRVLRRQGCRRSDPCSLHPHRQTVLQPGVPAGPAGESTPARVPQIKVDLPRKRWEKRQHSPPLPLWLQLTIVFFLLVCQIIV